MRIVQITPGSGDNFYCENCLRDRALVGALRELGHDVILVPFYLPFQSPEEAQLTDVPIFCLLQDEDGFVDGLPSPYAEQAWDLMRRNAREVDGFLAVSEFYDRLMAERLDIPRSKRHVVPVGIPVDQYAPAPARLKISGGRLQNDEPLIRRLRQQLGKAGHLDDVTFLSEISLSARVRFLQDLTVLTVPEKNPVAYGLYVLEALACAVPVVQPAIGVFPELIENTQGGLLHEGTSAAELAQALKPLLLDSARARALGQRGREGVHPHYDIGSTAEKIAAIVGGC